MTAQVAATLLLALAALIGPGNTAASTRLAALGLGIRPTAATGKPVRHRGLALPIFVAVATGALPAATVGGPIGLVSGALLGAGVFIGSRRIPAIRQRGQPPDPLLLASSWDLLAACLRGGLPVPAAVNAIADDIPGDAATALRRTAELIALGADPVAAWAPALANPLTAELARGARRTARSGAALAGVAEALAVEVRAGAHDLAEARAQRAAVGVTGPLGLCFLPAFLCIGVVPVVIGLASRLIGSW